jgi:anionic cell wall polymer biosynthesis LytR-Cps2A-Psr (LCP) family protein
MASATGRRVPIVRTLIAASASISLLVSGVAAVATVRWIQLRDVGVDPGFEATGPSDSPEPPAGRCSQLPCNYLLLGSDSRAGLGTDQFGTNEDIGGTVRADTIMLVHTDPGLQKAIVLSFPRDLWVRIRGRGFDRINTAFEGGPRHGGPQRMAQTVSDLTGLTIHHYLYVDLEGFRNVVDTIGGVDMCIPAYNVNTPGWLPANGPDGEPIQVYVADEGHIADPNAGLNIAPGCQRLDGEQALAYVRARHLPCDDIPDFSRIGRQQQFLRAVINQMLQPSMVVRAPALVPRVLEGLRRDERLLPSELVYLVGQLRGLSTGAVEFRAVPGVSAFEGEKSVVEMDPSADRLFAAIRDGRPIGTVGTELVNTPPSEANITVAVVDQRSDGIASRVEGVLAEAGFDVTPGIRSASDGPGIRKPAIVFAEGAESSAGVVAAYFPDVPVVGPRAIAGAEVAIVVPDRFRVSTSPDQSITECPAAGG